VSVHFNFFILGGCQLLNFPLQSFNQFPQGHRKHGLPFFQGVNYLFPIPFQVHHKEGFAVRYKAQFGQGCFSFEVMLA